MYTGLSHRRKLSDEGLVDESKFHRIRSGRVMLRTWVQALLAFVAILLLSSVFSSWRYWNARDGLHQSTRILQQVATVPFGPVMVSYSYFEKDPGQLSNAEFFIAVGMGISSTFEAPTATDFTVVISGDLCTPCKALLPLVRDDEEASSLPQLVWGKSTEGLALLQRTENEGMDFAAHNVTIEWLKLKHTYRRYKYFIFLNSSVRGPFFPSYMPPAWQWTRAYTDRLTDTIKVVSSSLVCLPALDAGGFGPKVESWAFAVDPVALNLLSEAGVFYLRTCKLCDDGVVVLGEYGLSNILLSKGYNLATLMSKYPVGLDWREDKHWHCNNNVHPSRHGTYDGISMHPFETMFLKASWHVGEPHLTHYTDWYLAHAAGNPSTGGAFNEPMYRYAVTPQAQEDHHVEACYKVI